MSVQDREKWDDRYRAVGFELAPPSALVERLLIAAGCGPTGPNPSSRAALDIAAGAGRHSVLLAQWGWQVTALDISSPGLEIAARRAAAAGVPLDTLCVDLDESPLPPGPWQLVLCTMFVDRTLFARVAECLAPRGCFIYVQPTHSNLARHEKPPAGFLLNDGEMPSLLAAAGFVIEHYEEGWLEDGRHDAAAIARRP